MAAVVYLRPASAGPERWDAWYADAEGWQQRLDLTLAQLHELAETWSSRPVQLLLRTCDLFVSELDLEPRQLRQGREGLRFLIEDQVSCDLDDLQIILGQWDGRRKRVPLMAVERERLSSWLEALAACAIQVGRVHADALVLGASAETGVVWADQEQALLACSAQLGYACAHEHLPWVQEQVSLDSTMGWQRRGALADADTAEAGQTWSDLLAAAPDLPAAMNFLQGDFKPQRVSSRIDRRWWQVAALYLVAILVLALDFFSATLHEQALSQSLARANVATYQTLFPGETRIVNLALQIQGHLNEVQGSGANVLKGMQSLARALHELALPAPLKISYDARSGFDVDLVVDAPHQARLRQSLQQAGFSVRMSAADAHGVVSLQFHD